jgi:hypothetical protein
MTRRDVRLDGRFGDAELVGDRFVEKPAEGRFRRG